MLHPTDPIRGKLLLGFEQQLINERIAIQQRRAHKQHIYRRPRRAQGTLIKVIVRLLAPA